MENAIKWFANRAGRVTYSMTSRLGPSTYDCSSAVYLALQEANIFPQGIWIGNTDSLFRDLENHGFEQVKPNASGYTPTQRGDVFIWGVRGASGGAAGHTGIMTSASDMIHCSYGRNGIQVDSHNVIWEANGRPQATFYRRTGNSKPVTGINIGSMVQIKGTYTANRREVVHGITQVTAVPLYIQNFDWTDNGIPNTAIYKVDNDGYWLSQGVVNVGDKFVIPGSFRVSDLAHDRGVDYALLDGIGGYSVWVATKELSNGSKAVPKSRPAPQPTPAPTPKPTPAPTQPPQTPAPTVPPETPRPTEPPETSPLETQPPVIEKPIEEEKPKMAFKPEEVKALNINSERIMDQLREATSTVEAEEIRKHIPLPVKVAVYIVADLLILAGAMIGLAAMAFNLNMTVEQVIAWSGLLAGTGGGVLAIFGLLKGTKKSE